MKYFITDIILCLRTWWHGTQTSFICLLSLTTSPDSVIRLSALCFCFIPSPAVHLRAAPWCVIRNVKSVHCTSSHWCLFPCQMRLIHHDRWSWKTRPIPWIKACHNLSYQHLTMPPLSSLRTPVPSKNRRQQNWASDQSLDEANICEILRLWCNIHGNWAKVLMDSDAFDSCHYPTWYQNSPR